MSGKTISSSYSSQITLAYPGDNPTTITSGATIAVATDVALYAPGTSSSTYNWTIDNAGTISATGTSIADAAGIKLGSATGAVAAAITNSGSVYGYNGIYLHGSGTLTNSGAIIGFGATFYSGGIVASSGSLNVTNTATGLIQGYQGIYVRGSGAGSVYNFGSINGIGDDGVRLNGGGGVTNNATALIYGTVSGISLVNPTVIGIVDNFGTVSGGIQGIYSAGGTITNEAGGYIYGDLFGVYIGGQPGTVTNQTGGLIAGNHGIDVYGVAGTVTNYGSIDGFGGAGIRLEAGGIVNNGTSGIISGDAGIQGTNVSIGSISNYGTISGSFFGVYLDAGGNLINHANALIYGGPDAVISNQPATVANYGTIAGPHGGGIDLAAGGTVINAGTIFGYYQSFAVQTPAISFGGTGVNLLVIENGSQLGAYFNSTVYSGLVQGSTAVGATNTVEIAGSVGAPVTLYYDNQFRNFQDVRFGSGGYSTLYSTQSAGTLGVTLSGFNNTTDSIRLNNLSNAYVSNIDSANNLVTVTGMYGSGSLVLQFDSSDSLTLTTQLDPIQGTDLLVAACYCRGTMILTEDGEVAIEDLKIGDRVVTVSGEAKPIKWIGHRAYDGRFVVGNREVLPIRVAAGALADCVPARDLLVSPEHSLYFDGVLVAAHQLLNGATITQETAVKRVEYFHIELDMHDIIFADGAPAESYVDCDNRGKFHNAGEFATLYPEGDHARWQFCAPRLQWDSEEPNAIRTTLMARAEALGHRLDLDPDLHLVVDGAVVRPDSVDGRAYYFIIPAGSTAALLASRSTVPAEIRADARDLRRLGVPVERLVLRDADLRIEAAHGHAGLRAGFHDDEPSHRWTDGRAALPESWLRSFRGAFTLEVHLIAAELPYRVPPPARARTAA